MSGTPRGLEPTGIEFDLALGAPGVLKLGRLALGRAATAGSRSAASRAAFGRSTTTNYRKTYFDVHPTPKGRVIVHHAVEQQVLKRYPGVVTEAEMYSLENLRGIPKEFNAEHHLRNIRKEWSRFYKQHPSVTKQQLLDKATEIDRKYGHLFVPPVR